MSVKTKLARQAVRTTAKHTAHGTASKFTRKPYRTTTLLALGVAIGGLVGWLIGRSGGGSDQLDPVAQAPSSPNAVASGTSSSATSSTGAVS
jgi:hypothetical protein